MNKQLLHRRSEKWARTPSSLLIHLILNLRWRTMRWNLLLGFNLRPFSTTTPIHPNSPFSGMLLPNFRTVTFTFLINCMVIVLLDLNCYLFNCLHCYSKMPNPVQFHQIWIALFLNNWSVFAYTSAHAFINVWVMCNFIRMTGNLFLVIYITAHSSLDEYVAHWFGLNQSKYQWALDDYYESNAASVSLSLFFFVYFLQRKY